MKVGFARVSTKEQDLNVQLSKLDAQGCEKIFQGKQSGASIRNEDACLNIIDGSLNTKNDNPFATAMINLCGVFVTVHND